MLIDIWQLNCRLKAPQKPKPGKLNLENIAKTLRSGARSMRHENLGGGTTQMTEDKKQTIRQRTEGSTH